MKVDNSMVQQASSFKQSVESALGADNVVVDLQKVSDDDFQNIPTSAIQRLREITISQAVVGLLTTKTHRLILKVSAQ